MSCIAIVRETFSTPIAFSWAFMFTYGGGSFIAGILADRFSPVAMVGCGLLGSSLCLFLIAYGTSTSITSNAALSNAWFFTCQLLHGGFHATAGPGNIAILANWLSAKGEDSGKIFLGWASYQYLGQLNIFNWSYDQRWSLNLPTIVSGIWAIVIFFRLPSSPKDIDSASSGESERAAIGFFQAITQPKVLRYALAFGFFKLVHYAMLYQLPKIITSRFDPTEASIICSSYMAAVMSAGLLCYSSSGYFGGRRARVIASFMGILCPLLYAFSEYIGTASPFVLLFLAFAVGFLLGVPLTTINTLVAADLADDISIKTDKKAAGTVTGIIEGIGLVIAAFGQLAIPVFHEFGIVHGVGYKYVWYFLILSILLGISFLTPLMYNEV